jgi:hypothetical protein
MLDLEGFYIIESNEITTKLNKLYSRKRRLKWVATLPLGDINTEAWSSGMGLGVGLTTLPCKKLLRSLQEIQPDFEEEAKA